MQVKYPPVGYFFSVHLENSKNSLETSFMEAKGFGIQMEYEPLREGGENRFEHKLPKGIKYTGDLELSRGLVLTNTNFGKWCWTHLSTGLNTIDRKTKIDTRVLILHLLDAEKTVDKDGKPIEAEPIMSWAFTGAYPVKWRISELHAQKNAIVVESITIAYAYFDLYL